MRSKPALDAILNRIPEKWGRDIRCDEGWYSIVIDLDFVIAALYPDYEVYQVKEKFGGLRYYCSVSNRPQVMELIRVSESFARITCEICGKGGKLRAKGSRVKTLCGTCAAELGFNKEE